MFRQKFIVRTLLSLVVLCFAGGIVSCTPSTEQKLVATVNPHFDTNYQQPVVPLSSYAVISKRMIGPTYTVEAVTPATTTLIYDDAATAPCRFQVPTKNVELKASGDSYSYLRMHYKDGVDQKRLVSCADLTASVSRIEISAEPDVAKQFASQ